MHRPALLALTALLASCSSSALTIDGGYDGAPVDLSARVDLAGAVDLAADAGRDLALRSDGGAPCGNMTCGMQQVCIIPCCGGPAPRCFVPDGGQCTPPLQPCPFGQGGCYSPCTPPPPRCIEVPAECLGNATCDCLSKNAFTDPCTASGLGSGCGPAPGPGGAIECVCA